MYGSLNTLRDNNPDIPPDCGVFQIITPESGRRYYTICPFDQVQETLVSKYPTFEVALSERNPKIFFDVDHSNIPLESILDIIQTKILKESIERRRFAIYKSGSDSYHIIVRDSLIESWPPPSMNYLNFLINGIPFGTGIDRRVYTTDRLFRVPYSEKVPGDNRPFLPLSTYDQDICYLTDSPSIGEFVPSIIKWNLSIPATIQRPLDACFYYLQQQNALESGYVIQIERTNDRIWDVYPNYQELFYYWIRRNREYDWHEVLIRIPTKLFVDIDEPNTEMTPHEFLKKAIRFKDPKSIRVLVLKNQDSGKEHWIFPDLYIENHKKLIEDYQYRVLEEKFPKGSDISVYRQRNKCFRLPFGKKKRYIGENIREEDLFEFLLTYPMENITPVLIPGITEEIITEENVKKKKRPRMINFCQLSTQEIENILSSNGLSEDFGVYKVSQHWIDLKCKRAWYCSCSGCYRVHTKDNAFIASNNQGELVLCCWRAKNTKRNSIIKILNP